MGGCTRAPRHFNPYPVAVCQASSVGALQLFLHKLITMTNYLCSAQTPRFSNSALGPCISVTLGLRGRRLNFGLHGPNHRAQLGTDTTQCRPNLSRRLGTPRTER